MNRECTELALLQAQRKGDTALTPEEQAFARRHLEVCLECQREQQLLGLLRYEEGGEAHFPIADMDQRRAVQAALVGAETPRADLRRAWWQLGWLRPMAWGAVASAAAAVVLVLSLPRLGSEPTSPTSVAAAAPGTVLWIEGASRSAAATLREGDPVELGSQLEVEDGQLALALAPALAVQIGAHSSLRVDSLGPDSYRIFLQRGRVHVDVVPGRIPGGVSVSTPLGDVAVTGTIFEVEVDAQILRVQVARGSVAVSPKERSQLAVLAGYGWESGWEGPRALSQEQHQLLAERTDALAALLRPATVAAVEGPAVSPDAAAPPGAAIEPRPEIEAPELATAAQPEPKARPGKRRQGRKGARAGNAGAAQVASREGEAGAAGEPAQWLETEGQGERETPSAKQLLDEARALRGQQRWEDAARVYRKLIRMYPEDAASQMARVTLGALLLDHMGSPSSALRMCEAYLARNRSGAVAQEAALCRIRALRALGRPDHERAALREFIDRYPDAVQLDQVQKRLQSLSPTR